MLLQNNGVRLAKIYACGYSSFIGALLADLVLKAMESKGCRGCTLGSRPARLLSKEAAQRMYRGAQQADGWRV